MPRTQSAPPARPRARALLPVGAVFPFILRGVSLLGVDSVYFPAADRAAVWQQLADSLAEVRWEGLVTEVGLGDLPGLASEILAGQVRGRVVVDTSA